VIAHGRLSGQPSVAVDHGGYTTATDGGYACSLYLPVMHWEQVVWSSGFIKTPNGLWLP
jgi:hypothetical protein